MIASCHGQDLTSTSTTKVFPSDSDSLIVAESCAENSYLKNREFWEPFDISRSLFTDPKNHADDKYLYLVHAPSRLSFDNPSSLKNLLISASLINQKHNKTYMAPQKGVFILKVPKNLIFATSPFDVGLDNDAINPINFDDFGVKPGMSDAEIRARIGGKPTDPEFAGILSILKYGNRLRLELRNQFRKFGIHHPYKVLERAAIRRLSANSWSSGHTEIVVLVKYRGESVEVAGVLFFKDAPGIEKRRFLDFAHKYSIPSVELDHLIMNPTITSMPEVGEVSMVQKIPIIWD
jgi:hypothetical protein